MAFLLVAPQTSRLRDFREKVNLTIQDLGRQPLDLHAYVAVSTQQLESMLSAEILESARRVAKTPDGVDSHRILSAVRLQGRALTVEQICRVVDGKAYILTFTSRVAEFQRWKATAERILESFVLES